MRGQKDQAMTSVQDAPYWDPYDLEIGADPHAHFKRLREGAPLYYNEKYDFYALSRYEDVMGAFADRDTFASGRGAIVEIIKSNVSWPRGLFAFEDPPRHTMHRSLVSRVFTPKRMAEIEKEIRDYCKEALDPVVGTGKFDFVRDLGAEMPMQVIGMLLGVPEEDRRAMRDRVDAQMRLNTGKPRTYTEDMNTGGDDFEQYIAWRERNPSDDLMTQLLNAEFEDETGTKRRLERQELLTLVNMISIAGNETTNRLIGWAGKILAEHPDQRRQIVENRALIPQAIEELLRYEPPAPHLARYVTKDTEYYGQKVPAGSAMSLLIASANRDENKFNDGGAFNINRERHPHLSFGHGFHVCIGNALARVEARIALDEVLNRFPEWETDLDNAYIELTPAVRGWETMPTYTDGTKPKRSTTRYNLARREKPQAPTEAPAGEGEAWTLTLQTPMGPQTMMARLNVQGATLTGQIQSQMGSQDISGTASGDDLAWTMSVKQPMPIELSFKAKRSGDTITGEVALGAFGTAQLSGVRA
jgi:cytochrome P450